jgi:hypothetical protein
MFHERSRPVGAAFLLAGICGGGAWSVVGAGASHHYDQRCGVPCRRKSRGGNAADFLADIQHGQRQSVAAGRKSVVLASGGF